MPLIKAQCTNCGATLEVDNTKEAAICPFCNSAYIVEKAINQYTINNKFNIENASINITSGSIEEELEKAETYLYKLHNLQKAAEIYETITEKYPNDYRGWWGEVIAITDNLKKYINEQNQFESVAQLAQNAFSVMPSDAPIDIQSRWNTYKIISLDCIQLETEYQNIEKKKREISASLDAYCKHKNPWIFYPFFFIILLFAGFVGYIGFSVNSMQGIMIALLLCLPLLLILAFWVFGLTKEKRNIKNKNAVLKELEKEYELHKQKNKELV